MHKRINNNLFYNRRKAFTLPELLVTMTVIAAVVALTIPAVDAIRNSADSTGAKSMLNAALATARTLAISKQNYVGIRIQPAGNVENGVLDKNQYIIFVGYDLEGTNWKCGFSALTGYKPIKLPANLGVMDMLRRQSTSANNCGADVSTREISQSDLDDNAFLTDTSTFTILFSAKGKLVLHEVRCGPNNSADRVINTKTKVQNNTPEAMFIEDDGNGAIGIGIELSRNRFIIYDKEKFKKFTTASQKFDYLDEDCEFNYINTYTGGLIE